jgi:hypothetical protein
MNHLLDSGKETIKHAAFLIFKDYGYSRNQRATGAVASQRTLYVRH